MMTHTADPLGPLELKYNNADLKLSIPWTNDPVKRCKCCATDRHPNDTSPVYDEG